MATVLTLPLTLPAAPSSYTPPKASRLSAPGSAQLYPAGPSYLARARRTLLQRSYAEDDAHFASQQESIAAAQASAGDGALYPGLGEEVESPLVLASDPKEWKKQDHYAILGLGGLRYLANDEQIKVAHRRKVLRHHPDKKAGAGANTGTNDDAFFKCIQKAHETLTNRDRRRQFDSVDWNIEDSVPDFSKLPADKYCTLVAPIFAREGRFSTSQPVPGFGTMEASKKEVEGFYDFWYNFDSWRSFEWYDKEVNEGSDSRDDKRYTEKKNKSERTRRKKEDNTRLREMVDEVLAHDPRIKRIKAEEKAARAAKKGGPAANGVNGTGAKKLSPAEIKAQAEAEKAAALKQAEADKLAAAGSKADREAAKKAKEAARKNLKKWKKAIAGVFAENNYWADGGAAAGPKTVEGWLGELDKWSEMVEPEEVKGLKEKLDAAAGKKEEQREAVREAVKGKEGFSEMA